MTVSCHVCGAKTLKIHEGYRSLNRVTSDCKPWPAGGELAVCKECGSVQTLITPQWQNEIQQIYREYTIYHQSGGTEQSIFDQKTGKPMPRSARLLEEVIQGIKLPNTGKLLDIGCGNGQLLKQASRLLSGWSLYGSEYDGKYESEVLKISGVKGHFIGAIEDIQDKFDIITLVHVLEHIPNPRETLNKVWEKLNEGGILIVDVPDFTRNPFIMLVADHCTHFSTEYASELLKSCGFQIEKATGDWIPKESVVVARKTGTRKENPMKPDQKTMDSAKQNVEWLTQLCSEAKKAATQSPFGIFGTSIGATFLKSHLNGKVQFFLDEDPHRVGKTHLGLPIHHPTNAPSGSHVFLPLAPMVTQTVLKRLQPSSNLNFHWVS